MHLYFTFTMKEMRKLNQSDLTAVVTEIMNSPHTVGNESTAQQWGTSCVNTPSPPKNVPSAFLSAASCSPVWQRTLVPESSLGWRRSWTSAGRSSAPWASPAPTPRRREPSPCSSSSWGSEVQTREWLPEAAPEAAPLAWGAAEPYFTLHARFFLPSADGSILTNPHVPLLCSVTCGSSIYAKRWSLFNTTD